MFSRFWKDGCQEGLDAERLEDSSTEQPEVVEVERTDEGSSAADHLSTEEALRKLADDRDPPVNPEEPEPDPADHDPGESIFPRARSPRRKPRRFVLIRPHVSGT